jgi:hypothetical protein
LLAAGLVDQPYFKKHGLFGFEALAGKPFIDFFLKAVTGMSLDTARLMKNNTNAFFGLLEYAKQKKDKTANNALLKWVENTERKFFQNGFFSNTWHPKKGASKQQSLEMNHAAMDAFLEAGMHFESRKWVELAEQVAENWWKKRTKLGLVPEGANPKQKITLIYTEGFLPRRVIVPSFLSRLDSQVDFAVVLGKLFWVTGKKKYQRQAEMLAEAIWKHHRKKERFYDLVNGTTGSVLSTVFPTKFLGLLLKPYLMLHALKEEKVSLRLWSLLRDR